MDLRKLQLHYRFQDPKLNMVLEDFERTINRILDEFGVGLDRRVLHTTTYIAGSFKMYDWDASNTLKLKWNEGDIVNRTINLKVGGLDRTFELDGNLTVESASLINQDATTDSDFQVGTLSVGGTIRTHLANVDGTGLDGISASFIVTGGTDQFIQVDSASWARFIIDSHDADAEIEFQEDDTNIWVIGFDYGDSNKFKICEGNVGTNTRVTIASGGATTFASTVTSTAFIIGANTLDTNEWAYLDGQNQALKTSDTPQFAGLGLGVAPGTIVLYAKEPDYVDTPLFERSGLGVDSLFAASRYLATKTTAMGDGFGVENIFLIQDDDAVLNPIAKFGAMRDGADNSGAFVIKTYKAGAASEVFRADKDKIVTIPGALTLSTVINAGADVDKFLVLDAGDIVDFRTGTEILADLSGDAGAAFSWNSQNLTNVGTIGAGQATFADSTIADDARGLSSIFTLSADPAKSDGIALYSEGHIGAITTDGSTDGAGIWLNIDSGAILGADVRALDIGIYERDADCRGGNAYGLAIHMDFDVTYPPAAIYPFRLNTNVAGATPDALIFAANKKALAVTEGTFPFNNYLKVVVQDGTVYRIPVVTEGNENSMSFTGATTENKVIFPDNLPDAFSFKEGANFYQTFVTSNGSEKVAFGKNITIPDASYIGSVTDPDAIQIEASGNIVMTQRLGVGITPSGKIHSAMSGGKNIFYLDGYSTTTSHQGQTFYRKSHSNIIGTIATTLNAEFLGDFVFQGVNAAETPAFDYGAIIRAKQNGVATATNVPTDLFLYTYGDIATNTNQLVLNHDGNIGFGTNTFGTNAVNALAQLTGVAPTTSPADCFQVYSADIVADHAAMHIRNENDTIIKLYQQAHIVDAPGDTAANNATTINAILVALENAGLLAAT